MQLAPLAPAPREPPRSTESDVQPPIGRRARPDFAADEQAPIIAALTGEIVKRYLHDRESTEQFHITFSDRFPATPDPAHRVIHARCVPLLPIRRKPFQV